jgi:hypothetical protein
MSSSSSGSALALVRTLPSSTSASAPDDWPVSVRLASGRLGALRSSTVDSFFAAVDDDDAAFLCSSSAFLTLE